MWVANLTGSLPRDYNFVRWLSRGAEEDTGNGRLAARALVPVERGLAADRRYTVVHHGRRQMLDHILLSRALLAYFRGAAVHNETLEDELVGFAAVQHDPQSYHAPVSATFALPDR